MTTSGGVEGSASSTRKNIPQGLKNDHCLQLEKQEPRHPLFTPELLLEKLRLNLLERAKLHLTRVLFRRAPAANPSLWKIFSCTRE